MSSLAISYFSEKNLEKKRKLGKNKHDNIIGHIEFIRENGIIPLLKSGEKEFEQMFDQAIRYYSLSTIQMLYSLGFRKSNIRTQRSAAKSFSLIYPEIQNEFSKLKDVRIKSTFMNAIDKMEDYLLLATDPKINVNKPRYTPLLEASFGVWVCILALKESNDNYKDKQERLINKCLDCTKILEEYIMLIAQDHGRVFSNEVNEILENIDSGKVKTITQPANQLIKQMRKELAVKK